MHPGDVGLEQSKLVLGKHSGKHAFGSRLKAELGYGLTDAEVESAFDRFKILCDKKKIDLRRRFGSHRRRPI